MKAESAKRLDTIVDRLADECDALLESEATAKVRKVLQELSAAVPELAVEFVVSLRLVDDTHEEPLRLLTTGYSTSKGDEPYLCHGDSTAGRYVVNGEICQVPHDQCPNCWSLWDFKMKGTTCPSCGFVLGREIKLLLDSDVCPNCEEGRVTLQNPTCTKCDFVADDSLVTWG